MALEGSLSDFGLADILQLIYFQRKTGILSLEGRMDRIRLLFIDGNIAGAESKRRIEDNRLGKILLKKDLIKEEDLQAALKEQQTTGAKLGNILINKEIVKKEIIKDILKSQITETVIQIFSWKQGTYEFSSQGVPQDKEFSFSIDTQHLLMEGLRIIDEWSLIKGKLTLDSVFIKKTEAPSNLTEEEKEIFLFIDGENDVSTIIDISDNDDSEVSKILLSLLEKNVIEEIQNPNVLGVAAAEKIFIETRKSFPFISYVPFIAIIVSLLLSFLSVLFTKENALKEFKASKHVEELRFRIEAFRLNHSVYPQNLEQISHSKDSWGRHYIYRVSDNSFYLISAGADGKEGTADDIY